MRQKEKKKNHKVFSYKFKFETYKKKRKSGLPHCSLSLSADEKIVNNNNQLLYHAILSAKTLRKQPFQNIKG